MIAPGAPTNAFTSDGIALAPTSPGVYAIVNSVGDYIYFGEAPNLRERLREHLADSSHCMHQHGAAAFVFELIPDPVIRLYRQHHLKSRYPSARCHQADELGGPAIV